MFEKEIKKFEGGDMMWKKIVKVKEDVLAGEHSGMSKKSKELVERILKVQIIEKTNENVVIMIIFI